MPTLRLDAYSKAYPSITNRIRASIFTQSNPQALISTIIDTTVGHPERVWTFLGLPRNNYGFSLDEIDGSDNVVSNLASFAVVPGTLDGTLNRDDEQIEVDVTDGFDSGLTTVTFDGTAGKPNYIGWEIVPSELTGRGILNRGLDYSWDKVSGIFTLLQAGDELENGTTYNIHFNPISQPAGGSYPTLTDFLISRITASTTLDSSYFGKKLIVEPAAVYMTITLPDIATIPEGRKLMIEVDAAAHCCVKVVTASTINWLNGNIYICRGESLSIYKYDRSGTFEWRVDSADGNFRSVGQSVGDDATSGWNKQLLDGSSILATQFARLYNEFVLNLPGAQVVNYDDWATGNNKYLYSLANSANPANVGKFKIPDRRNLFERNNNVGKAGDYQAEMIKATGMTLRLPLVQHISSGATFGVTDGPLGGPGYADLAVTIGAGTETRPVSYLINKYVLI